MERATKPAYSANEVFDAQRAAIASEFKSVPIKQIREAVSGGSQKYLILDEDTSIARLEKIRSQHRESVAVDIVIDTMVANLVGGSSVEDPVHVALEYAVNDRLSRVERQMAEHFLRKMGSKGLSDFRSRIAQDPSGGAVSSVVQSILDGGASAVRVKGIAKKGGLDEGVSLSGGPS